MDYEEAIGVINRVESEFPVHEWEIDGIQIWPLLRIQIAFNLYRRSFFANPGLSDLPQPRMRENGEPANLNTWAAWRKAERANREARGTIAIRPKAVLIGNCDSRTKFAGSYYDKFLDPIADAYEELSYASVQIDPLWRWTFPKARKAILYFPYLCFFEAIKRKTKIARKGRRRLVSIGEFSMMRCLSKVPELKDLALSIKSNVEQIERMARMLELYFRFCGTKIVYTVCYYTNWGFAANVAAHRLNIPTVDMVHGCGREFDVSVGRWPEPKEDGWAMLPNVFWCWDQDQATTVSRWADSSSKHFPYIGGQLWMQQWQSDKQSTMSRLKREGELFVDENCKGIRIMVTPYYFDDHRLFDLIEAAPSEWNWLLRMHPNRPQDMKEAAVIVSSRELNNVQIQWPGSVDLHVVLPLVDVHLTESSSTILESMYYGVPSVAMKDIGRQLFPGEVDSGWLAMAESVDEIIFAIKKQLDVFGDRHNRPSVPRVYKGTDRVRDLHKLLHIPIGGER